MFYIILLEVTLLLLLLAVLFHKRQLLFRSRQTLTQSSEQIKNMEPEYSFPDHRNHFRVPTDELHTVVELIELENKQLAKLKNKKFEAYIENISIGGIKFSCPYQFPVKDLIKIKTTFTLHGQQFTFCGEVIRKEEHHRQDTYQYGVQYIHMTTEEETRLYRALNEIVIETRKSGV